MNLSSGECLKFVQAALVYKLEVIYSAVKITLVETYQKTDIRIFDY